MKQVQDHRVDFEENEGTNWELVVKEIENFPDVCVYFVNSGKTKSVMSSISHIKSIYGILVLS